MLHLSRELRDVPGLRLFVRPDGPAQVLAVELTVRIAGGPFVVIVPVPAAGEVAFTSLAAHPRVFDPLCAAISPNLPGRIHADNIFERVAAHVMWQSVEPRLLAVARAPGELVRVGVPEALAASVAERHPGWAFVALAVGARQWGPDVVQLAPFVIRYARSDARVHVPGVFGAPRAPRLVLTQARLGYDEAGWVGSPGAIGAVGPAGLVNPARPVIAVAGRAPTADPWLGDLWLEERVAGRPRPWSFREARAAAEAGAAREAEWLASEAQRLAAEAERLADAAAAAIEAALAEPSGAADDGAPVADAGVAGKEASTVEVQAPGDEVPFAEVTSALVAVEEVTEPEVTAPEVTAPLEPELELDPDEPVEEDTRPG